MVSHGRLTVHMERTPANLPAVEGISLASWSRSSITCVTTLPTPASTSKSTTLGIEYGSRSRNTVVDGEPVAGNGLFHSIHPSGTLWVSVYRSG